LIGGGMLCKGVEDKEMGAGEIRNKRLG